MDISIIIIRACFGYLIGSWAKKKDRGFWLGFILAFVFSPIISGVIVLLLKDHSKQEPTEHEALDVNAEE